MEEEYGLDHAIGIVGTDDEAQTYCCHADEDDDDNIINHAWPQTYRRSMDMFTGMTPPSISFLTGSPALSSPYKRSQLSLPDEFTPTQPLMSTTSLDKEEVPTTLTLRLSTSSFKSSYSELPQQQKCSFSQSVLNAINVLCGIGILSTPYAIKEAGWWSLSLLVIFGIITCYTGILLQRCLESSPRLRSYPDIGQAAFGIAGRICIAAILYMELYSSCVEYLIMMCDNLSALYPNAHLDFAGMHLDSYYVCSIISTLVILPTVWLRDLSLLSYISVGGVLTLALVVICLLWVGVVDGIGFHPGGTPLAFSNLPVTVGLFGFCYGSHSVFPNLYSSMNEPNRFPSVLIISFITAGLLYMGVGICGYLMFGEAIKSQFTLNMPVNFVASKVAAWTVVIAPVTKYALTITPIVFSIEELLPSVHQESRSVSILVRTMLVISTLVITLAVPYFGSMMALIGSFLVMLVAVIFPCICYLRINQGRLTKYQIVVNMFIVLVGVICAIAGTYSAVTDIMEKKA
ncbi:Vacuolar amino acid transporter 1 [Heracleum sosnowskyi]|uniref:Vacuolar amino acid transporter 1 n=1 Tax=Heracleum sosnowskyi TaxID=360622 RepID=A0AAD8N5T4_9APIA|nr:Vacuolar amino acid transporter 1 [Heracleum sosnowskyi]